MKKGDMMRLMVCVAICALTIGCGGSGSGSGSIPSSGSVAACDSTTASEFLTALSGSHLMKAEQTYGSDSSFVDDQEYEIAFSSTGITFPTENNGDVTYTYDETVSGHSFRNEGYEVNLMMKDNVHTEHTDVIVQLTCAAGVLTDIGIYMNYQNLPPTGNYSWKFSEEL